MILEIALTRLFSAALFYNYVFLVLSLAFLGLAAGAAIARSEAARRYGPAPFALFAGLTACVAGIAVTEAPEASLWVEIVLAGVPYLCLGTFITLTFTAHPDLNAELYAADWAGAALGAVLAVPVLKLGATDAVLASGALLGVASLIAAGRRVSAPHAAATALTVAVLVVNLAWGPFALSVERIPTGKPMFRQLRQEAGSTVVASRWDAFARTDVVQNPAFPNVRFIYVDGAAGSTMWRFPRTQQEAAPLFHEVAAFPLRLGQAPQHVMVIGPGGGREVLIALLSGSEHIAAVEVNPGTVDLVRSFAGFNGRLYERPQVAVTVDEGRSYVRRAGGQYDLIYLPLVVSLAAEGSGYMLTENYLYTVEAFGDYLAHLKPGGSIALLLYDDNTLFRAFLSAFQALRSTGLTAQAAADRMIALYKPNPDDGRVQDPLLLIRNVPFSRPQVMKIAGQAAVAGLRPIFLPNLAEVPPLDHLRNGTPVGILGTIFSDRRLTPVTDDSPFFYEFERGLPPLLRWLVGLSAGAAFLVLLVTARPGTDRMPMWPWGFFFASLGTGFMLAEVALIQKAVLTVGHPTLALSVTLTSMLLGAAAGSRLSRSLAGRRHGGVSLGLAAAAIGLGVLTLALTLVNHLIIPGSVYLRIAVTGLFLAPAGIALGLPFPLGLHAMSASRGQGAIADAWMVNGAFSVLGSVSAMAIAILWGFSWSLWSAVTLYGALFVLFASTRLRVSMDAGTRGRQHGGKVIRN